MKKGTIMIKTAIFLVLAVLLQTSTALGDQGFEETGEGKRYVDEAGNLVKDAWIQEDSRWYYANARGWVVTEENGWVKVNGKRYRFDGEGVMLTGWQEVGDSLYYFSPEAGTPVTGWNYLEINIFDDRQFQHEESSHSYGWFWFNDRGVCYREPKPKQINGRTYYFDENGMMLYGWVHVGSDSNALAEEAPEGEGEHIYEYVFCGAPEDGSRKDGWIYAAPPEKLDEDGEERYYYLKKGRALSIFDTGNDGTYRTSNLLRFSPEIDEDTGAGLFYRAFLDGNGYAFNYRGEMQEGLFPCYDDNGNLIGSFGFQKGSGEMLLEKSSGIEENDGEQYTYYFKSGGDKRGLGVTGIYKDALYYLGKRQEADETGCLVVSVPRDIENPYTTDYYTCIVNRKGVVQKKTGKKYETENLGDVILWRNKGALSLYAYQDSNKREDYQNASPLIEDMSICEEYLGVLQEPEW